MVRRRVSSVPVVDDTGQLVDIYTKFDVIVSLHESILQSRRDYSIVVIIKFKCSPYWSHFPSCRVLAVTMASLLVCG